MYDLVELGKLAKKASREVFSSSPTAKDAAILSIINSIKDNMEVILSSNKVDIENSKRLGLKKIVFDKLNLTEPMLQAVCAILQKIIELPNPSGETEGGKYLPNGVFAVKARVPVGVIGMASDGNPISTIIFAAMCIKTGNAGIIFCGRNAYATNMVITKIIKEALEEVDLSQDLFSASLDISQETLNRFIRLKEYIDLIIPDGDIDFIKMVVGNASIPVLDTGRGNCHIYIDKSANLSSAVKIVANSKIHDLTAVNAVETILVHEAIAKEFLPRLEKELRFQEIEMHADQRAFIILEKAKRAKEEDWQTDYRDQYLAVKVVDSFDEAIEHIDKYSMGVAEGIVANDLEITGKFSQRIDAAAICINTSLSLFDAMSLEQGVQLGLSSQKLHCRGPIDLKALTTIKYIITGNGNTK